VMQLVFSQLTFGRPYILPPGTPPERVAALRRAFMAALKEPDTVREAQGMQLDLDPLAGEAVQQEVAKAYAMPARIVERARASLIYKP
jgi:tripartite-type tricarboxylate transporter receptor subunit TctC